MPNTPEVWKLKHGMGCLRHHPSPRRLFLGYFSYLVPYSWIQRKRIFLLHRLQHKGCRYSFNIQHVFADFGIVVVSFTKPTVVKREAPLIILLPIARDRSSKVSIFVEGCSRLLSSSLSMYLWIYQYASISSSVNFVTSVLSFP